MEIITVIGPNGMRCVSARDAATFLAQGWEVVDYAPPQPAPVTAPDPEPEPDDWEE